MFYTIYKITNKINGKIYIGKHQTKDLNDGYMGSGKNLRRAISKYGIENFEKEILFQFDTEHKMNSKEAELVTEEFCLREDTYNLCPGGQGGWGYINHNILTGEKRNNHNTSISTLGGLKSRISYVVSDDHRNKISSSLKGRVSSFHGKSHTEETKEKMRKTKNKGSNNSQYGTMWITNGVDNKKIRKEDVMPEGWYKGRK